MKTTISRKISIALLILSLVFVVVCFILLLGDKAVTFGGALGTLYASFITLGFGGGWKSTTLYDRVLTGNAAFAIAFILAIIAMVLSIVLIYGYISKKFLPKVTLNLSVVIVIFMLFVSICACFTRQAAAGILAQELNSGKHDILQNTHLSGSAIALIVFGFLSVASYIAFAAIPYIKNKITKK